MKWNQKFWTPRPSLTKDDIIRAEFSVKLVPSSRFSLACVCMLTMMNMFLLRTHFNFAMVCMVKQTDANASKQNITDEFGQSSTVHQPLHGVANGETFFGAPSTPHDILSSLHGEDDDNSGYVGLGGESMHDVIATRSLLTAAMGTDGSSDVPAGGAGHLRKSPSASTSGPELGALQEEQSCSQMYPRSTLNYEGEFDWSRPMQGALFGSFYYGYISSMVIGGMIGDLASAKWLLMIGTTITGLLTLVVPSAAWISPHALVAVRALQGVVSGLAVPCVHQLVASWASPAERPILMGLAYSGVSLGYALSSPFASFFCSNSSAGWPWIFYVSGAWSCLCVGLILYFVYDSPAGHPRISPEEREYLLTVAPHSQSKKNEKHVIPWSQLLTSVPFLAICVCHFCINWGFYVLAIMLPTYMRDVLKFDVKENGMLSALPYIGTAAIQLTMGRPIDWVRRKRNLSTTTVRKACNTFGMCVPALALVTLTYVNCSNRYVGVALTVAAQSLLGVCFIGGFFVNHADLAPRYAGTMMGITNTVGNIQGFLAPQLTTLLTPQGTREEWLVVFYIGAAAYAFGAIFFLIFGSGEVQPWATSPTIMGDAIKGAEEGQSQGVKPEDLADAILAAAARKISNGEEIIGLEAFSSGQLHGDVGPGASNAVASGATVCRRASRGHLKPMVPDYNDHDEKTW